MASRRAQKIAAAAAAGIVLLGGATITSLAAWTDQEYVQGGVEGEPGITTSSFEVLQNTTDDDVSWVNEESSPGGVISFSVDAAGITPGDTVYGFVRLMTDTPSLGGDLTLNGAVAGTGTDQPLFAALTYGARIVAPEECDADGYDEGDVLVADGSALTASSSADAFSLMADGNDEAILLGGGLVLAGLILARQRAGRAAESAVEAMASTEGGRR